MTSADSSVIFEWRGALRSAEVNALHAQAFETRLYSDAEWNWVLLTEKHSLGWVTARRHGQLIGFVNLPWDGLVHAWIQDLMVASEQRRQGIGVGLVQAAREGAMRAGCEFLHVDFEPELKAFYIDACGFKETGAGLLVLRS